MNNEEGLKQMELSESNDSDVQEVVGDMPKVSPEVFENNESNIEDSKKKDQSLFDNFGREFDPEIHDVNKDGSPILNKNGKIKCKRGGNRRGPQMSSSVSNSGQSFNEEVRVSAEMSTDFFIQTGEMVFGESFRPVKNEKIDERADLVNQFKSVYRVYGPIELKPEWLLAYALLSYTKKRFEVEEAQNNFGRFMGKMKNVTFGVGGKLFGFLKKIRKKRSKKKDGAHVDPRQDGERKNTESS